MKVWHHINNLMQPIIKLMINKRIALDHFIFHILGRLYYNKKKKLIQGNFTNLNCTENYKQKYLNETMTIG